MHNDRFGVSQQVMTLDTHPIKNDEPPKPATVRKSTGRISRHDSPKDQIRPRSIEQKFRNIKGVNIHIHNLKKVQCRTPFNVYLKLKSS